MTLPAGTTIYEWYNSSETPSSVYTTSLSPNDGDFLYDIYGNVLFTIGMFEGGSFPTVYSSDLEKLWERDYSDTSSTVVIAQINYTSTVTHNGVTYTLKDAEATARLATKQNILALNEGEILTDTDGYNTLTKYLYETFDINNFTVVGSPSIVNGVASGFSNANYLKTPQITQAQSFVQTIKFTTSNTITNGSALICEDTNTTYFSRLVLSSRKLQVLLTSTGSNWNIGTTAGTTTLSYNTTYYVRFSWTGTKYLVDLSTDGITYTNEITINSSTSLRNLGYIIGKQGSTAFNGSIDLKNYSISVDDVLVFTGNKFNTELLNLKNYTIVGNPSIVESVASGFSEYDSLATPFKPVSNTWEIQLKTHFDNVSTVLQPLVGQNGEYKKPVFTLYYTKMIAYLTSNGTSYNIANEAEGSNVYAANTDYWFKFGWTGTQYYLDYSTNGKTYTRDLTITSSTPIYSNDDLLYIGRTNEHSLKGYIDLSTFKIYINNELVFQPYVKVPCRISLTGDKVAEKGSRSEINYAFSQIGVGPYFTLDTVNKTYTLPQGELYGMFVDRTIPHVVKAYNNGTSGYLLLSNNFLFQYGETATLNSTIYLLESYGNKNYRTIAHINATDVYTSTSDSLKYTWNLISSNLQPDSFDIMEYDTGTDPNQYASWFAWGYKT